MTTARAPRYQGIFPVAPTTFTDDGRLDLESQKRCIDFMIDAGSHGVCILANFSEQFAIADDEREQVTRTVLEHVAGRVPVIVTTTHYSSRICAERSRRAQDMGAAMVMVMPPYHGATFRVPEPQIVEFFRALNDAIDIPIMIQDAPASGTVLSVPLLARLANELDNIRYFKIEVAQATAKIRELIKVGGAALEGPWDGEEGITMYPDLEAGATGCMSGGGYPDGLRPIFDEFMAGRRDAAFAGYQRWLPLINFENRQAGLLAAKALMKEGGIIASEAPRHPLPPMHPVTRAGLIDTAKRLDVLALRWAR
jgi:2-keto-3-deoxy-L-arabinonate dehydratase